MTAALKRVAVIVAFFTVLIGLWALAVESGRWSAVLLPSPPAVAEYLWSALWDGWCVAHFDADGHALERTPLPVQRPTSVAFGGPALTDLYVTSASVGLSQAEIQNQHLAGDLFRIPAAAAGLPEHRFGRH